MTSRQSRKPNNPPDNPILAYKSTSYAQTAYSRPKEQETLLPASNAGKLTHSWQKSGVGVNTGNTLKYYTGINKMIYSLVQHEPHPILQVLKN